MRLFLATPRGFCAGVDRAVNIVNSALKIYGAPLYVKHEIVHNKFVVEQFQDMGVIFVESTDEVPEGSVVVFSAHGSAPAEFEEARKKNLKVIDATCPLVMKVHLEARRFAREGYSVILIGHKGHQEVQGTSAEMTDVTVIETVDEAHKVIPKNTNKIAYLSQTTLSVEETAEIIRILKERFPNIVSPPSADICFSTTNRQNAVRQLAKMVEVIYVVGSKNSSNSNRLREVAESNGAKAFLIDNATELNLVDIEGVNTVGVTAGASAPDILVNEVVEKLRPYAKEEPEEVVAVVENIKFPLPPELEKLAKEKGIFLEPFQKRS